MRHKSILYPVCRVDLVELEPGESFTFSQKAASASYGVFALGGTRSAADAVETTDPARYTVTTLTSGAVPGRMFNQVGKWIPNTPENGWSNDVLGHEAMTITAGEQGAQWICLGRVSEHECQILPLSADGNQPLPSGWGVLGIRREAICDGIVIGALQYFAPREQNVPLICKGDALLIRHLATFSVS
jgi:hypothetical protein